ncbi:CapA family protein [Providencia rettgeri]|uniref:CapA family protein n=1 Tax=Providencia TaxID=586 RepID=UPI00234953AD|nr:MULTISPECIES: CapA family protein [Providencia]MDH2397117.1 CapA family protein [Providencia rettgeri]
MITFTGDVYLPKPINIDFELDNDIIVNLEFPITCDLSTPAEGKVNLSAPINYLNEVFLGRVIAANLANNHILDFQEPGFLSTIESLKKNNIPYFGAGTIADNFNNPFYVEKNNNKILVYGYCDKSTHPANTDVIKVADLNLELIKKDLDLYDSSYFKIVCLHWGAEENPYPSNEEIKTARRIIDFGADAVIGHHAHVIQGHEKYNGKDIFFNLGNFCFEDLKLPSGWNGVTYTNIYNKKQSSKNKEGLILDLSSELKFTYRKIFKDSDNIVLSRNKRLPKFNLPYAHKFYNNLTRIRIMTVRFVKNPRIPSFYQIKRFLGL